VCVYTCVTVIDKVLLRKEVNKKVQTREYKYKKILRQRSILAVNFWSVTYFCVFNFGTSYLGAKIGQNKTITKIYENVEDIKGIINRRGTDKYNINIEKGQ
jgi:hypothetical protein